MYAARKKHLALVHVPDTAADPLVEQSHCSRCISGPQREPTDRLFNVGIGQTEIRAEMIGAGRTGRSSGRYAALSLLGANDPHVWRGETDGDPPVIGLDRCPCRTRRTTPALPRFVYVPASAHLHVSLERCAISKPDKQIFTNGLHRLDDRSWWRPALDQAGGIKGQNGLTFEHRFQPACSSVHRVAFWHIDQSCTTD